MKIDLHAHSSWSDGADSVTEVFRAARAAGVDVLALTDHDTTKGWEEACSIAAELGMGFVPGIEVTTRARVNVHRPFGVHMLAYLPDPSHPALGEVLGETLEKREVRLRALFDLVAPHYPITWQDVLDQLREGATFGRPALAAALVARGHFEHTNDVFAQLWGDGDDRFYIPNRGVVETIDAIRLIRQAGGVPVIAHPMARGKGPVEGSPMPRAHFIELIEAGLAGFEVFHRDVPEHARRWLIDLAKEFDLVLTGSSDYHGNRKHNLLGENTTTLEMLERIVAQASGTPALL
ncbi:MAG: hypothetical protein RLZZ164_857 [Actinomycetota bacterium]